MEAKQLSAAISLFHTTQHGAISETGKRHQTKSTGGADGSNLDSAMAEIFSKSEVRKSIVKISGKRSERKK